MAVYGTHGDGPASERIAQPVVRRDDMPDMPPDVWRQKVLGHNPAAGSVTNDPEAYAGRAVPAQ